MITYRNDGGPESMDFDSNFHEVAPRHALNPNPWRRVPSGYRLGNPVPPARDSRFVLHTTWAFAAACALMAVAWSVVWVDAGVDALPETHRMV